MDASVTFARHFARLVWLLIHEPGNVDEQKAALRALLALARDGAVVMSADGNELAANGDLVPIALTGVGDVVAQMAAHGIATVTVDAGPSPADLLGVARILAGTAIAGDEGSSAEAKRLTLGAATVRFGVRSRPPVDSVELAMEFGDVVDEEEIAPRLPTPRSTAIIAAAGSSRPGGLFDQFSAARAPVESHEHLLGRLEQTGDPSLVTSLLDDLVVLAEQAARDGKPAVVHEILYRIVRRETAIDDSDAKRAFVMTLRRLARPVLLRAVVTEMPLHLDRHEDYMAVLVRAGEDGADALIEQIAAVTRQSERRVFFDVLVKLQAGVPALLHMLGDSRWFVARNAADLLGEMQARDAEQPLTELLRHDDDRVRRSATGALMRLGTPRATQAIQDALRDGSPALRIEAATALLARRDVRTTAMLLRALDVEKDNEVQSAFLQALGKLGTPEAVQRLLRASEAERGLFKKKTTATRVAATQGLGEARTTEAMDALRALQTDKDPDVRDAATSALGRISRQSVMLERQAD